MLGQCFKEFRLTSNLYGNYHACNHCEKDNQLNQKKRMIFSCIKGCVCACTHTHI